VCACVRLLRPLLVHLCAVQVQPGALRGALEIFAGFFTSPLFNEGGVARELKAVDAEHSKNIQNDMWRVYQLDK